MNFICLAPGCVKSARLHLVSGNHPREGLYIGDSFCSIECLAATLADEQAAAEMRRVHA